MEIKLDGEYQTRDGRAVRVLCVDARDTVRRAIVLVMLNNCEHPYRYSIDGKCLSYITNGALDLIEKPKKHKRTYWLAHYVNGCMSSYIGESNVDYLREHYGPDHIAITGPHEIEFVEGEGLVSVTLESEGGEG